MKNDQVYFKKVLSFFMTKNNKGFIFLNLVLGAIHKLHKAFYVEDVWKSVTICYVEEEKGPKLAKNL